MSKCKNNKNFLNEVKHRPSKHETLSSSTSTTKKKKRKKEEEVNMPVQSSAGR
jgi:hypothetical protein